MKLILASGSPRRKELLAQIAVQFQVQVVDMDESMLVGESAEHHVIRLAREKARSGFEQCSASGSELAVLAADTVVEIDGEILGKPSSVGQAAAFLARLSARKHRVHTGVALATADRVLTEISSSEVEFMALTSQQIDAYVKTGEPMDKAGAYAIQGIAGQFVVGLNGSYSGVVGLPLYETTQMLSLCGITSFNDL